MACIAVPEGWSASDVGKQTPGTESSRAGAPSPRLLNPGRLSMQFSSFLNSRLSNTLEAQQKGPLNSYEQAASAYYGPMVRSADGRKTGTFNVFGMPRQSFDSSDLIA